MNDYLLIERVLSGTAPIDKLNATEQNFCVRYGPVFEIGRMAGRMARGYYAHKTLIDVASDPRANALVADTGGVPRKDGTKHVYDMRHYLEYGRTAIVDDLERIWLSGALIAVGDQLDASKPRYLSRAPLLELVYHLRNAAAHGNKFHLLEAGVKRLKRYEAHNKEAQVKNSNFEIKPDTKGPLLFEFMKPGDVLDILQSVEVYLTRIRERRKSGELLDDGSLVVRLPRS